LQEIFEKIREAIHKNGIRTTEFFKDHDKLRRGEITENQVSDITELHKILSFVFDQHEQHSLSSGFFLSNASLKSVVEFF